MSSVIEGVDQRTQLVGRNRMELLMFRLVGRQRFGINVFKVREVIRCPVLTHLPQAHPVVRGIASIRGVTITIMDLAAAVGLAPVPEPEGRFVIVAEYNRRLLGFLVDCVDRIVNLNWERIRPPPRGIGLQNYLTAVTEVDGELVEVIDVEKVLAEVIGLKEDIDPTLSATATAAAAASPPTVLYVDDSALARRQIKRVLDQLGVRSLAAESGRAGYDLLLRMLEADPQPIEQRLAMVISDVEMPEMDGYTFTRNIKEHPGLKRLWVVLHTSLSGNFNKAMAAKVGADDLMSKFDPDELASLICRCLEARTAA